jgi:hypothetical protein
VSSNQGAEARSCLRWGNIRSGQNCSVRPDRETEKEDQIILNLRASPTIPRSQCEVSLRQTDLCSGHEGQELLPRHWRLWVDALFIGYLGAGVVPAHKLEWLTSRHRQSELVRLQLSGG